MIGHRDELAATATLGNQTLRRPGVRAVAWCFLLRVNRGGAPVWAILPAS